MTTTLLLTVVVDAFFCFIPGHICQFYPSQSAWKKFTKKYIYTLTSDENDHVQQK